MWEEEQTAIRRLTSSHPLYNDTNTHVHVGFKTTTTRAAPVYHLPVMYVGDRR